MFITVNGKKFELRGFQPLDEEIDQAFRTLFTSFFNDSSHDFSNLIDSLFPPFEEEMFAFFDRNQKSSPLQDGFFSNLTFIWNQYFQAGRFGEAQSFWQRVIRKTREWEQHSGIRIHKGSALYFWSATAILQGEVDKGFFLMHRAVEEDILTSGQDFPNTPAFMFVTLNFQESRQFFYGYVKSLADYLNQFFNQYRMERTSHLTIEDLRARYLEHPPSIHSVFSLSYHPVGTTSPTGKFKKLST